jgi:uncharacterized protein YceH (UPF0502 family)
MQRTLHKVTDHPMLRKDPYSKAILNVDPAAVQRHSKRAAIQAREAQQDAEIKQLKDELAEIRALLSRLRTRGY